MFFIKMNIISPIITEFESKLIILLTLESFGILSLKELTEVLVAQDYLNYLLLATNLDSLVQENSIEKNDIYYKITNKGVLELDMFINYIPNSIKSSLLLNAPTLKKEVLTKRNTLVLYHFGQEYSIADMYFYNVGVEYVHIVYHTPNRKSLKQLNALAKKNKQKIYYYLLEIINRSIKGQLPNANASSFVIHKDDLPYISLSLEENDEKWNIIFVVPNIHNLEQYAQSWACHATNIVKGLKKKLIKQK